MKLWVTKEFLQIYGPKFPPSVNILLHKRNSHHLINYATLAEKFSNHMCLGNYACEETKKHTLVSDSPQGGSEDGKAFMSWYGHYFLHY